MSGVSKYFLLINGCNIAPRVYFSEKEAFRKMESNDELLPVVAHAEYLRLQSQLTAANAEIVTLKENLSAAIFQRDEADIDQIKHKRLSKSYREEISTLQSQLDALKAQLEIAVTALEQIEIDSVCFSDRGGRHDLEDIAEKALAQIQAPRTEEK